MNKTIFEKMNQHIKEREHNKALDILWEGVNKANQYMNDKAPWGIKDDPDKVEGTIYNLLYMIHGLSALLAPAMPEISKRSLMMINKNEDTHLPLDTFGKIAYTLGTPEVLFEKFEVAKELGWNILQW